jgi:hypothetical protein
MQRVAILTEHWYCSMRCTISPRRDVPGLIIAVSPLRNTEKLISALVTPGTWAWASHIHRSPMQGAARTTTIKPAVQRRPRRISRRPVPTEKMLASLWFVSPQVIKNLWSCWPLRCVPRVRDHEKDISDLLLLKQSPNFWCIWQRHIPITNRALALHCHPTATISTPCSYNSVCRLGCTSNPA